MPVESAGFYLDEDLPHSAAAVGRALGLDVVAAVERGQLPKPDRVHLGQAASEGRILVTYNRNDFIEETRDAFAAGRPHAGVLILTHRIPRDPARIAHALQRWQAAHASMQPYEIQFLSA